MQPMTLFYKFYKRFSRQKYLIVFIYLLFVIILAIVLPFIRNLEILLVSFCSLEHCWSMSYCALLSKISVSYDDVIR